MKSDLRGTPTLLSVRFRREKGPILSPIYRPHGQRVFVRRGLAVNLIL
jgi:hypothetical protein